MHFIDLDSFSTKEISNLINRAIQFKTEKNINKGYSGLFCCNIFLEPSTRTLHSFKMAQTKLNIRSHELNLNNSSILKNETFKDTILTLREIGYKLFVIRSSDENIYNNLTNIEGIKLINAGLGTTLHPSQTLLDLMTIFEHFGYLETLNVLFVGDVKHSRVFNSNYSVMKKLGIKISVFAPKNMLKVGFNSIVSVEEFKNFDVIIFLRTQIERHAQKIMINDFNAQFGLNELTLNYVKKNAIIMHPGPVNYGVEISSPSLKSKKIKILEQVKNGVFARMAILEYICEN